MALIRSVIAILIVSGVILAAENSPDSTLNSVTRVKSFDLLQNYPNPFNPSTTIQFTLPRTSDVKIEIYDLLGNKVKQLVDGRYEAGVHSVTLNASDLAAGVYFYSMTVGDDYYAMRRMTLVK